MAKRRVRQNGDNAMRRKGSWLVDSQAHDGMRCDEMQCNTMRSNTARSVSQGTGYEGMGSIGLGHRPDLRRAGGGSRNNTSTDFGQKGGRNRQRGCLKQNVNDLYEVRSTGTVLRFSSP